MVCVVPGCKSHPRELGVRKGEKSFHRLGHRRHLDLIREFELFPSHVFYYEIDSPLGIVCPCRNMPQLCDTGDIFIYHIDSILIFRKKHNNVQELQENISCYFDAIKDDLPLFENEDIGKNDYDMFEPSTDRKNVSQNLKKPRHIFFHETSCRGDLTPRQACTIESTARAHPNWTIHILISAPITKEYASSKKSVLSRIKTFPNVKIRRLRVEEYVKGTPAEKIITKGQLNSSKFRISHASDVLRFTTLFKHPGVYLDLDIIVVRPLDSLARNFAIRESKYAVAVGAIGLDDDELGRSFSAALIEELSSSFNGNLFGTNGPGVMTRVLKSWCDTKEVSHMNEHICQGISVYRPAYAYPVKYTEKTYFEAGSLSPTQKKFAYMYHVWGKKSQNLRPHQDSPFHRLAKKYCPVVYEDYKEEFGFKSL